MHGFQLTPFTHTKVNMEVGFGDIVTVDLVPGGGDIPVTESNRHEYVAAYTAHLLETSIDRQFTHFRWVWAGGRVAAGRPQGMYVDQLRCSGGLLAAAAG